MDTPRPAHRRRATVELAAAAITLAVWVGARPFNWHQAYILFATAAWGLYCLGRLIARRVQWRAWGLVPTADAWLPYLAVTLGGLLGVLGLGLVLGFRWVELPWWTWPIYVAWAFTQEFAVQNIVGRNLDAVGLDRRFIPPLVGLAFAAGHWPAVPIALLAGAAGVGWTWIYLRRPNLWALGLSHALLGSLANVGLLGLDPAATFQTWS